MVLVIKPGGQVEGLYDEILDLACLGSVSIQRASHVEPDKQGRWWADLSPVQGPTLGPFARRSLALAAERAWLETSWLGDCPQARFPTAHSATA
jgi:hypothetical protein